MPLTTEDASGSEVARAESRRAGRELVLELVFRPLSNLLVPLLARIGIAPPVVVYANAATGLARGARHRARGVARRGAPPPAEDAARQLRRPARACHREGDARRTLPRHRGRSRRQRRALRRTGARNRRAAARRRRLRRLDYRAGGRLQPHGGLPRRPGSRRDACVRGRQSRRARPGNDLRRDVRAPRPHASSSVRATLRAAGGRRLRRACARSAARVRRSADRLGPRQPRALDPASRSRRLSRPRCARGLPLDRARPRSRSSFRSRSEPSARARAALR